MAKVVRGVDSYKKEFLSIFNSLCGRHGRWEVWSDFIQLTAIDISNATDKGNAPKRATDARNIAKKYSKDEIKRMAEMLMQMVYAIDENPDQDFLGELYMTCELGNDHAGQFFTPYNVCQAMSEISFDPARFEDKGFVSVNDCACGAGALLVSFANACKRHDINYQQKVMFVAQDIDYTVGLMCYMDITKFFFRIPTEVQLRELGRPLDDADMMWFFERAIRCDGRPLGLPLHCTDVTTAERIAGRGMQVGSLVSQMTANVVMTPADHYIKRELCAPYYARYMDDMGAIIEGKAAAWELVEEVDNYLQTNLGLNLNQKTAVIPIGNPVEFVGRKISPVKIELRRQTTLGMKKHLRYVQDAYAAGEIDLDYALSVITSYRGLFKDVTSDAFLEKMLDEFVLSRPALEA